jgi:AraC family transcriptional regulator
MKQPVWSTVRKDLRMEPLTEGRIGGDAPLYVERWVYQARKVDVSGIKCPVLITQLGGARVNEGDGGRWRSSTLPSQSILVPPDTATSWHYSGPVDDVVFYFLDPGNGIQERLCRLVSMRRAPMQFSDALVAAAAQQLVEELHSGGSADELFMSRLAELMLEQVFRVLTASNASGLHPGHTHFSRLQKVLRHINAHLAESLPNDRLASLAGVSESHFRRMFIDATGLPPHRYVTGRRLAHARKLLAMSELPISVIVDECGFYSQSHLTKCFQATHAVTPAAYRRQVKQTGR